MPKNNIVIAGGGFAGISALRRLDKYRRFLKDSFNVIVIDRKPYFEFLPMLPDVVGGWIDPGYLRSELKTLASESGAQFIQGEINTIDPGNKVVMVNGHAVDYEYAVMATGSETDFYGNDGLKASCHKIDNIDDAVRVYDTISRKRREERGINAVVVGGGYTGIEIATNIDLFLKRQKTPGYNVYIVERAPDILASLPCGIGAYVSGELEKLNIKKLTGESLKEYDGGKAFLTSGREIPNALCVWAAGVHVPPIVDDGRLLIRGSRIEVDKRLKPLGSAASGFFVAGDSAYFRSGAGEGALRMAIMFSMGQGKVAADNIVAGILKTKKNFYYPLDLGYIVPMAHGKASGKVMGAGIRGRAAYLLHYFMCAFRSERPNIKGVIRSFFAHLFKKNGR